MRVLFASARKRRITPLARLPSSIIHSTERRAAFRSGVSQSSQRRQASALATTAASGWFTSWAIEAVSCPIVVTRLTCASSIWASRRRCSLARSFFSARLRSVMSMTNTTPSSCFLSKNAPPTRTGTRLPQRAFLRTMRVGPGDHRERFRLDVAAAVKYLRQATHQLSKIGQRQPRAATALTSTSTPWTRR